MGFFTLGKRGVFGGLVKILIDGTFWGGVFSIVLSQWLISVLNLWEGGGGRGSLSLVQVG